MNHIIYNHIKVEISLHFVGIWPTVRLPLFLLLLGTLPNKQQCYR